jgi:hypothetical protein
MPQCETLLLQSQRILGIRIIWCSALWNGYPENPSPGAHHWCLVAVLPLLAARKTNRLNMTITSLVDRSHVDHEGRMRLVVVAASLGTVFEWYDFFLYGSLAVFFSALFFPPGNETAAFLASLATFGAGFAVRPFGALVFGALSDRVGRKRSFLITMVIMGVSTLAVGLLPTYAQVGIWAPILLVTMRLA